MFVLIHSNLQGSPLLFRQVHLSSLSFSTNFVCKCVKWRVLTLISPCVSWPALYIMTGRTDSRQVGLLILEITRRDSARFASDGHLRRQWSPQILIRVDDS